ncbi:MAG: hypothetical protein HY319_04840 [Armatimonadetes bacterium]|nr:hypothetical protein [Armatimonadota bacterium]
MDNQVIPVARERVPASSSRIPAEKPRREEQEKREEARERFARSEREWQPYRGKPAQGDEPDAADHLAASGPPATRPKAPEPADWTSGPRWDRPLAVLEEPGSPPVTESPPEEEKKSGWQKVAGAGALALAAIGAGAGIMGTASPAFAAQPTASLAVDAHRDQTAVSITNAEDAVARFNAQQQLYVKGAPMDTAEMGRLQEVLRKNPNTYIILVDHADSLEHYDRVLSRGIGNSSQFQSVVNERTGEKDGVLLMVYYNSNQGRKMFMRAEALPDRLGVGELDFADPNDGSPRKLLNIFLRAYKQEGKDVAGSLEAVVDEINGTINRHVAQVVDGAQNSLNQATSTLSGFEGQLRAFQRKHGSGGELGSPPVDQWRSQLDQAGKAFQGRDFAAAQQLSQQVVSRVQAHEQAMARYEQAPGIAREVREDLKELGLQLETLPDNGPAGRAREHYRQAMERLTRYDGDYEAKNVGFWENLETAQKASEKTAEEAKASIDQAEFVKNARNAGFIALGAVTVAAAVISNHIARKKRKEAKQALADATAEISDKSQKLIALMEQADYHSIANYAGKTKKMADELIENVTDALTLVGGAEKFLAQAEALIQPLTPVNLFTTKRYKQAIRLLTDKEERLPFSLGDSSRAVLEKGSKAEGWREELLKRGASREFKQSLYEVLLAMAEKRDTAEALLDEITTKNSEINQYLTGIQTRAEGARDRSLELQEEGKADRLFTAPPVTKNLLPMVLAPKEEGGLLAQAHEIKTHDPVRAWDDYGVRCDRMANEAGEIVTIGKQTRGSLLPTLESADRALHPHEVKTDWAHERKGQLSERLDDAAHTAMRVTVKDEMGSIRQDVAKLETRIETVVDQDQERREVSPGLIRDAEQDVTGARQEIHDALKAAGVFQKGEPDMVLRELDRDPTARTVEAHANLEAIKPRLDAGDMEQAAVHLENIRHLTADAHRLVRETREALASYPSTLAERQTRTEAIDDSIPQTYQPSLDRIGQTYVPEVQKLVAPEVQSGDTIADDIYNANAHLGTARALTGDAQRNFGLAYLLTSRDELEQTDRVLKSAQSELDRITRAEELLAQKQQNVESELSSLDGRVGGTRGRASEHYVRDHAQELLQQTETRLGSARSAVGATPRNPYDSADKLSAAENLRGQTESAIDADKQAYESAVSAIRSAQSAISSASARIAWASTQSWSYSSSEGSAYESVSAGDLFAATSSLSSAESYVSDARRLLDSKEFESAAARAQSASSEASQASSQADWAVASARSRFDSEVHVIKQREYEAEQRRRREEEERNRNNGSTGGGWGGGGGNGSTGGSW